MAILSEILALLDKWPTWKRITAAPDQIDALEGRFAALEKALKEDCPKCEQARMVREGPPYRLSNIPMQDWACLSDTCRWRETREL